MPQRLAAPVLGSVFVVMRREPGKPFSYLSNSSHNYNTPHFGPLALAKPFGDIRLAYAAARYITQNTTVPAEELNAVPVSAKAVSAARPRVVENSSAKARAIRAAEKQREVNLRLRKSQRGFFLLEIMIGLCILAVLAAVIAPDVFKAIRATEYRAAREYAHTVWNLEAQSASCHASNSGSCGFIDGMVPVSGQPATYGAGNYRWQLTADAGGVWVLNGTSPDGSGLPSVSIGSDGVLYCGGNPCTVY